MHSTNPATGKTIKEYQPHDAAETAAIVDQVDKSYHSWRKTSFSERAVLLNKVADVLEAGKQKYAEFMADEMGKVLHEGVAEIEKCAFVCRYYAEHGERFLKDEPVEMGAGKSFVTYQPIGIVLAVMPWNFPFWQVFRFAAPTIMAGNAALLKHASNVSGCALAIEEIFKKAGAPENLFRTLLVPGSEVEPIIRNPSVKAVTLTGSTEAGRSVAKVAGECLKKSVLELGGSDAYVVLADADIAKTVEICVKSRLLNAGQSCIAAKRFIVVDAVYDAFVNAFVECMQQVKMGSPLEAGVQIGPQASVLLRGALHKQVLASVAHGARCVLGGALPEGEGAFYPPTLLADVTEEMPAYTEELFGPVASVIRAQDEKDALRIANDSVFGLGGAIFTSNLEKGERLAREEMQSGACFVNDFVKSDPRLPFGGIKESGYGRELSGFGIREFVNIKAVHIA